MKDEPAVSDFASLANTTAALRAQRPNALSFINLLPNYASPAQTGAPTYTSYIDQYVQIVKPQVFCQ